jgi:hypothetical protein
MVVLLCAAFISLGLVNLDFSRNWWRGQRYRLAIGVPLVLVYVYVTMPPLVMPQAFVLLLLTLVPNVVLTALIAARMAIVSRRVVSIRRPALVPYLAALGAVALFAAILEISPVVDATGLRDVPQVAFSDAAPPPADMRHLRVVPEESAVFAGEKVIGQLGTYYSVGTYNVQVERGRLVWVAPLEFQGIIQWLSRGTSPGVIVVSAENPDAPPELRQRSAMRYIPSARLNYNLYRHVYFRYGTEQILETTLQLDDQGDPQYLCTLGRPTIGWSGQKVTAVVIVDPATGAMQRVARADFATLPHWVSRVYPTDLALDYNEWFGLYVHGWWNAQLAKRDVHVPARDEVFGLLATADHFVWFVDHTSPTATNQSMTGYTYMDTVDGGITYYTASGGQFDSMGAEQAVASNPTVRQGRLVPTQPILYNVYGQATWIVPLVADTGKYQSLALVQAANGRVVVGNAAAASPRDDAFAQYRAILGGAIPGGAGSQADFSGVIDRIATAGASVYFTLRGDRRIYVVGAGDDPRVLLARAGDRVAFHAAPDEAGRFAVSGFRDGSLAP